MKPSRHGLVIGKFYPPHRGHHAAIHQAVARCDLVSVLVMASAAESIALADRVTWLRAEHPDVLVTGVRCDAPLDVTDESVWRAQTAIMRTAVRRATAVPVDAVYCGDEYGDELARRLGAQHVALTRDELSATAVRADLPGRWDDLAPATRAGLTVRVVVVGAESTGTTTISRALAERFRSRGGVWERTQWVAEYGREYTEHKWAGECPDRPLGELRWRRADFDAVARQQTEREERAARAGSPVLICDTDAFATAIWERRYLGADARTAQPWASGPRRDLYLLTDHGGVPWHDDGLREGDLAVRAAMTGWFADALTDAGHSWVLLSGSVEQRVDLAMRAVEPLLALRLRFAEPLHGPGFGAPDEPPRRGRVARSLRPEPVPSVCRDRRSGDLHPAWR